MKLFYEMLVWGTCTHLTKIGHWHDLYWITAYSTAQFSFREARHTRLCLALASNQVGKQVESVGGKQLFIRGVAFNNC